jgi:RNA polymerase sigma factor (sigma-70 family)
MTRGRPAVADGAELSDGDLARLARDGDPVAFRLLVERHQPAVRARARRLCPNPSDVDDTVQESFLQAYVALDRLRDPDRFAGWLAGIVLNVCRSLYRREQLTLLPDWPEPLHPASADGLPSAEDLDRADALREADDAGHRDLPIWLLGRDSHRFSLFNPPAADQDHAGTVRAHDVDELTDRLLRAAGTRVTGMDIDELGPEVTVARIELAGPAGTRHVMARLPDGLAVAVTAGATIRVADAVLDRLAVPMGASTSELSPEQTVQGLSLDHRPRYEPRNMAFADGLDRWMLGGSFTEHAIESHWHDYSCAAEHGIAVLFSAVPQPEGFALLAQEMYADDYRDAVIIFRGHVRTEDTAGRAGLCVWVRRIQDIRKRWTEEAALDNPDNHIVMADDRGWTRHQITVRIPGDASIVGFGIFLAGPGRVELRNAELIRDA